MKKLILSLSVLALAYVMTSCYKDDLEEFKSIKRIQVEENIALPAITQTLDETFDVPILIPPGGGFTLADTVSVSLPKQDDSSDFVIDRVIFKGVTQNRFQYGGDFKMIFLDSLNVPVDTLPDAPDTWDISAGTVSGATEDRFSLTLDTVKYNKLTKASKIILQVEIYSGGAGIPPSQQTLDFTYFVGVNAIGRVKVGL